MRAMHIRARARARGWRIISDDVSDGSRSPYSGLPDDSMTGGSQPPKRLTPILPPLYGDLDADAYDHHNPGQEVEMVVHLLLLRKIRPGLSRPDFHFGAPGAKKP